MRRSGGNVELVSMLAAFAPGGVAVDAKNAYFTAYGENLGAVVSSALVLQGSTLFWVNDAPSGRGTLVSMPITGAEPRTIADG